MQETLLDTLDIVRGLGTDDENALHAKLQAFVDAGELTSDQANEYWQMAIIYNDTADMLVEVAERAKPYPVIKRAALGHFTGLAMLLSGPAAMVFAALVAAVI